MKRLLLHTGLSLLMALLCVPTAQGQRFQDTVHRKDGSLVRGVIVEHIPDVKVRIRAHDGTVHTIPYSDIERITRDPISRNSASSERAAGIESWYTYWALGFADMDYTGELDDLLDLVRRNPEVDHLALDLDLLGFYFPIGNDRWLLGGIVNVGGDRYQVDDAWFQLNQVQYSVSTLYFINQQIGRGFFARGDFGLSRLVIADSDGGNEASESGWGILLGGGYSFPISPGTRLVLNANYARKRVEGDRYGKFSLSIGGLF